MATEVRNARKLVDGVVQSVKMDKTITVSIPRRVKHPLYGKIITKYTKVYAHDENNECHEGDKVQLMETKPISKNKRWRLVEVLQRKQALDSETQAASADK